VSRPSRVARRPNDYPVRLILAGGLLGLWWPDPSARLWPHLGRQNVPALESKRKNWPEPEATPAFTHREQRSSLQGAIGREWRCDLGTQDPTESGLYKSASVQIPDPLGVCSSTGICTLPAVAVAEIRRVTSQFS
jgi:hypothetical protein